MQFTKLKSMVSRNWKREGGNKLAYLILGKPGGGKSALSMAIVKDMGGNDTNTVVFTPSLRDPVDVLGTPNNNGDFTRWVPPAEFYKLRHIEGDDSPRFLVVEELTDASIPMMNAMCRIVHDRHAGDLRLSDNLYIIATGNRTEDKSGANKLTTKLGNRLSVHNFDENLDDWVDWAIDANIDPVLIQFLRFKPNLLSDFNPNTPFGINPTPRQWEKVSVVDTAAPTDELMESVKGLVGEGAAAEYTAFRKIYEALVTADEVIANPTGTKIPKDLSAQFAIVGSLSTKASTTNIERIAEYINRLSTDFSVMFWKDTVKRTPAIKASKPFLKWLQGTGGKVIMG